MPNESHFTKFNAHQSYLLYGISHHSSLSLSILAVPTVPNNVMILSGVGNLTVTWMPPDLLNAPAVNYTVMYSSPTDFIVTSDTMVVIGSLAAFTEYSVMIQACSVAGCGPFTTPEIETTQEQGKYLHV